MIPGSVVAVIAKKNIVVQNSKAPERNAGTGNVVHTNTQNVMHVPVVRAAAKMVIPISGPTMTLPSQQKIWRPGHACHTFNEGFTCWLAMCSGIESDSLICGGCSDVICMRDDCRTASVRAR